MEPKLEKAKTSMGVWKGSEIINIDQPGAFEKKEYRYLGLVRGGNRDVHYKVGLSRTTKLRKWSKLELVQLGMSLNVQPSTNFFTWRVMLDRLVK